MTRPTLPAGLAVDPERLRAKGLDALARLMESATDEDDAPQDDAGTTAVATAPRPEAAVVNVPLSPAWRDLPTGILPEPLESFVSEAAAAIGCSRAHVATPLLPAVAAAIGLTRRVQVKADWFEWPIVWGAVVAESGGHKSPALRAALQFTKEREKTAQRDGAAMLQEHEIDLERYAAERESWRRAAAKGQAGDPPRRPERPPLPRYVVDDTTVEALAPLLADNPKGLLVGRDELGGWLASFDRYNGSSGGDVARWLSMHTGEQLSVDRKGGRLFVENAAVSVAGCIPPRTFARALGQEHCENGLLPRFLVTMPPRRRKVWSETAVSFATTDSMKRLFATLFELPMVNGEARVLDLTPEAGEVFRSFFEEHAGESVAASGIVASMLSKLEAYAPRLALVAHLVRQAAGEPTLPNRIDGASMQAGVALVRWYAGEARRLYSAVLGAGADDSRLVAWIRDRGGRASPRDVARHAPGFAGNTVAAEQALTRLVKAGAARWEPTATGGRPADTVHLV